MFYPAFIKVRKGKLIMQKTKNFTQGPILGPLMRFTLPVLAALFLQAMYGAVDLAVVGWFGTEADVSAVSTGSQIMQTITFVITGLAMGTTILLGQKLGQKKEDEAGKVIGSSICLFGVLTVFVTVAMLLASGPLASLMRAPQEAFGKTVDYVRVCSAGSIFIVAYNLLGSVFRGLGDSKTPLMAVAIACVCNIAGDLFFVAVLDMAAAGAALATALSQAVSVIICFFIIRKRGLPFAFSRAHIRFERKIISKVVLLGSPIALQDLLVSASFLAILAIVNGLGVVASAGVGVAEKLCVFIMLIPSAYMQSLSAFSAQNIGAGKPQRARRAMGYGMLTSFVFGAAAFYFSFFHGEVLAALFAKGNPEVITAAAQYLKAYAIDALLISVLFCFGGYFNGCGRTRFVMIQGIIGAFGVRIPVSYLMSRRVPVSLFEVGLATPCSTVIQILICAVYFIWLVRSPERERAAL